MHICVRHKNTKEMVATSDTFDKTDRGYIINEVEYQANAGFTFELSEVPYLPALKKQTPLTGDQVIDILLYLGYDLFPFY